MLPSSPCRSVEDYGQCVDRVEPACSQQKVEVVRTAKLLRQMYSAQCDKSELRQCLLEKINEQKERVTARQTERQNRQEDTRRLDKHGQAEIKITGK